MSKRRALPGSMKATKTPIFNSGCKYHQRRCKCHIPISSNSRKQVQSRRSVAAEPRFITYALPFKVADTDAERKALHHFCSTAVIDFANCVSEGFWTQFVLRCCQSDPTVQQAAIAVGNAHMELCSMAKISHQTDEIFQTAMSALRRYITYESTPSVEIILVCCILFYTFEDLNWRPEHAAVHLESALQISQLRLRTDKSINRVDDEDKKRRTFDKTISTMLVHLDLDTAARGVNHRRPLADKNAVPSVDGQRIICLNSRLSFSAPRDFEESWVRWCHDLMSFLAQNACHRHQHISEVPPAVVAEREALRIRLKAYKFAMEQRKITQLSLSTQTGFPPFGTVPVHRLREARTTMGFEIDYFMCKRLLDEALDDGLLPRPFDRSPERVLDIGHNILAFMRAYPSLLYRPRAKARSTWSHYGAAYSFFLLAHRTSYPHIRIQAVKIIRDFAALVDFPNLLNLVENQDPIPENLVLLLEPPSISTCLDEGYFDDEMSFKSDDSFV